jgi:hypothetical protein
MKFGMNLPVKRQLHLELSRYVIPKKMAPIALFDPSLHRFVVTFTKAALIHVIED